MALGWDTAVALAAVRCNIPFVAMVPFGGQESKWPREAQARYHVLLRWAAETRIVSTGGYSAAKMHVRNMAIVDACDAMAALWSGASGGTASCISYANSIGRHWVNLWPMSA